MRRTRTPLKSWCTRAVAAACLLLALQVVGPAHADPAAPPTARSPATLPLPPPGTTRLITIGPEMVLQQDSHGRIKMADEPPPRRSRGRNAAVVLLGAVSAGAILWIARDDLTIDVGGTASAR